MDPTEVLACAIAPRSVAVIGASENPNKIGGRPILYMKRHGYRGALYPINPARSELQGLKCYASLGSLPEVPELALVIVSGEAAVAAVDECAARGVKVAVVLASGFGETGDAGRAVQRAMVERARAAGMRIVGPNSQGLANFGNGAIVNFSTLFTEIAPQDGPVAIASQSGAMSQVMYGLVRGRGLGVRHVHATGNEADITVADLAWTVAHDPEVRLLLLYLETIADPEGLARTAAYARERDLPIVTLKSGRSASGQRAASSHTGALANEDRVVDAFFRHHGIWRVNDPRAMALAAEAYLAGWRPRSGRLVVVSNSGASCVMAADLSERLGLPLARIAPETRAAVAARLPGFASSANPIDVTGALLQNSAMLGEVLPLLARDPGTDLLLLSLPVAGAGYDVDAFARDAAQVAAATGKPVVIAAWQESIASVFRAAGLVTYADEGEALSVLSQLVAHTTLMRAPRARWQPSAVPALPEGLDRFLNEAQSLAVCARAGLPVVPHRLCRSAAETRAAFRELGAPVAIKACSSEMPHKSEHGLVTLNVAGESEAAEVFARQWAALERLGARRDGILVARMREARREVMVGARIDPVFGPVVMVGDGGKYVEALQDVSLLLPPFDERAVRDALQRLRIAPLLAGVRGEPALDVEALASVVVGVGRLIEGARGSIASLDLNPVLVGAAGEGAIIVDALVERRTL